MMYSNVTSILKSQSGVRLLNWLKRSENSSNVAPFAKKERKQNKNPKAPYKRPILRAECNVRHRETF